MRWVATYALNWKHTHYMHTHAQVEVDAQLSGGLTSSGADELVNTAVPPPSWERRR